VRWVVVAVSGRQQWMLAEAVAVGAVAGALLAATAAVAVVPGPAPPQPHISAGFFTSNIFWPNEVDATGTVYPCTYIPALVLANHTRLIAHGSCAVKPTDCNGLHLASRSRSPAVRTNPITEDMLCQKHSDDGGRTWSQIRRISNASQNGQIVWDDIRKVVVAMWSPGKAGWPVQEYKSHDLGVTWVGPRNMSFLYAEGPPVQPGATQSFWASAGAAVQLSPANPHHPGRLVFAGRMNGCGVFWYTDDGETYHVARNESEPAAPFCEPAIGETAIAETPDGGLLSSSRNSVFHGAGKCDCRATTRSVDGGSTFGHFGFDPALPEPECMATMINGGEPGAIFHANPGHGTDTESKSPPDGRASGTVRRSTDGGKSWASVVLNGVNAYSYSMLSRMPTATHVGLAWETVLPGSAVPASWSTNNIVFTAVPQNFTPGPGPKCSVKLTEQISKTPCALSDFGCYEVNSSMWVAAGCRGVFTCNGRAGVRCYDCPAPPAVCPPRSPFAVCAC